MYGTLQGGLRTVEPVVEEEERECGNIQMFYFWGVGVDRIAQGLLRS